jgi:hypothetical protein
MACSSKKVLLPAHVARRVAVEAHVDPRTIVAVAAGRHVRGDAGDRARAALRAAGLHVAALSTDEDNGGEK